VNRRGTIIILKAENTFKLFRKVCMSEEWKYRMSNLWKRAVKAAQLCCKVLGIPALSHEIMIFAQHYQSRVQHPREICLSLLVPLLS